MKLYLLYLSIAVIFVNAKEDSSSSEEIDFNELKKFVQSANHEKMTQALDLYNKTKSRCPNIDEDVMEATKKVAECVENVELGSDTVCSVIKKNFPKCTKPFVDVLINCLDEEFKFALPLGIKMITGFIDQACNSTVEEVLELFNPCIFDNDAEEEKIEACKLINEKSKDDRLITKAEVCDLRPKGKECLKQLVQTCKSPITKKTVMDFHEVSEHIMDNECNAV
ncbi:unnamed protein product [Acanthoscelides obtectus]|uniref:Uncharacterized protein n=1 Tax=Acanthoscelides obtectus TaxID=200917 RepID=A0A9P0LQV8_ACAOB|nr:unnamed protein product [Acanthoscelides obtectus]CAK1667079.1 hypothetical protein AOBTE_LOCUS25668 [Acanthoscelides obtectus]